MSRSLLRSCAAAIACCALAGTANAGFVLTIDDTSTVGIDVIIVDNSAVGTASWAGASTHADSDATVGSLGFIGSVGAFSTAFVGGVSKPGGGNTEYLALIDVVSLVATSNTAGTLIITITDTSFDLVDPPNGYYDTQGNVGGTAGGTVTFEYWADPTTNAEMGLVSDLGSVVINDIPPGPPGTGFSEQISSSFLSDGSPFSLSQVITVQHYGAASTSFNSELTAFVPEPTSMAILGLGGLLAGFGVARRKRKQAAELPV